MTAVQIITVTYDDLMCTAHGAERYTCECGFGPSWSELAFPSLALAYRQDKKNNCPVHSDLPAAVAFRENVRISTLCERLAFIAARHTGRHIVVGHVRTWQFAGTGLPTSIRVVIKRAWYMPAQECPWAEYMLLTAEDAVKAVVGT
jgi:hypothetical protein